MGRTSGWATGDWVGLADINYDGKADLVVHGTNNVWSVALSTGSAFAGLGTGLSGCGKGNWTGRADVNNHGSPT